MSNLCEAEAPLLVAGRKSPGMRTKSELGKIIEIANREPSHEEKAEKFLELMGNGDKIGHI